MAFIDPDVEAVLAQMSPPPRLSMGTPEERLASAAALRAWAGWFPAPFEPGLVTTQAVEIPVRWGSIGARVYRPVAGTDDAGVAVWLHGGGMVMGDLDKGEYCAVELALTAGLPVVSLDYRLAPEHPFPAGPQDCFDALSWLAAHGTELDLPTRALAVGGESAGGSMAAAAALLCVQQGGPSLASLLVAYPKLDFTTHYASYDENATIGSPDDMVAFSGVAYLPDPQDRLDPLASLTRAGAADLARMPSTIVLTAEADTLRDEAEEFGRLLRAAGAPAVTLRGVGMSHGFLDFTGTAPAAKVIARAAYRAVGDAVRAAR